MNRQQIYCIPFPTANKQDVCFLKIPKQIFRISPANAKLYAAYLDFKAFNPQGVISTPFKQRVNRFYYTYWLKKLTARRWATKKDDGYSLAAYQFVWRDLGVEQSWNKTIGKHRFTYHKIDLTELPLERKAYFIELQKMILTKVASNKVRQIRWRLATKGKRSLREVNKKETSLSSRTVAMLFGLKSPASGSKYRKIFFEVIEEATKRNDNNKLRYECKKIAL